MPDFQRNLPRNADRPIENSGDITFSSGVGTLALTPSSPISFDLTLSQNSTLTVSGETEDQVMNLRITHTLGPWTLSLDGSALTLNGASGETEYVTCKYKGSSWECQQGVVVDVTT